MTPSKPQILLGPHPFAGQSYRSYAQGQTYAAELAQTQAVAQLLAAAAAAGAQGCLCFYSDDLLVALKQLQPQYPAWKVYPVVPNVAEYSRAMNQFGLVGAGMNRVKRLGDRKSVV